MYNIYIYNNIIIYIYIYYHISGFAIPNLWLGDLGVRYLRQTHIGIVPAIMVSNDAGHCWIYLEIPAVNKKHL